MSRPSSSKDAPALKKMRIEDEREVDLSVQPPSNPIPEESILATSVPLPAKATNTRMPGNNQKFILNAVHLIPDNKGPKKQIYKYDFKIEYYRQRRSEDDSSKLEYKELFGGPKNDIAKMNRRRQAYRIFTHCITQNPFFSDKREHEFIFDQARTMFSIHKLLERKTKEIFTVDPSALNGDVVEFIGKVDGYRVTVEYVEDIAFDLKNILPYQQFLDVLTSQKLFKDDLTYGEIWCYPNGKFFYNRSYEDIKLKTDGRVLRHGFDKGVRPVGTNGNFIVQYETKMGPFYPEMNLDDFLDQVFRGRRGDMIWAKERRHRAAVNELIRNLVVEPWHLTNSKFRIVNKIDFDNDLGHTYFPHKEKNGKTREKSVYEYYREAHPQVRISRSDPVVQIKVGTDVHYYPVNSLKIISGQRVSLKKQQISGINMSQDMTRNCQQLPDVVKGRLRDIVEKAMFLPNNPWAGAFGLRISTNANPAAPVAGQVKEGIEADGTILPKPSLFYGRNFSENMAPDCSWKLQGKQFQKPVKNIKWALAGDVDKSKLA